MTHHLPVLHSIIAPSALIREVLPGYQVGEIASCRLYGSGFNDTYQVKTASEEQYYLRIYRIPWRTVSDVRCELDALVYLHQREIPVAYPLPRQDGSLFYELQSPEGLRQAVLFALAEGAEPSYDEEPEHKAYRYGLAVGSLHNGLEGFASPSQRFCLDLDHLVDKPLRLVESFLAHRPDLWAELQRIAGLVRRRICSLPESGLEWAYCHGDLQGFHHRISQDGRMTFIDFDCGGFGFRAYDLAVFRWCARLSSAESLWWQPYLQGYQEVRPLGQLDIDAIPMFVGCRYIWHMGVHCENSADWGSGWLNDAYFEEKIGLLRQVEADYLS